jgi:hypothetical protein
MAWDNGVSPPGGVSYAAPLMDFSEFGNLANVYRQAGFDQQRKVSNEQQQQLNQQRIQAGQQQQDIAKTFQGGLPRNADGSVDYASAVAMLAKKGDVGALWNGADVMAQQQLAKAAGAPLTPQGGAAATGAPSSVAAKPLPPMAANSPQGDAGQGTIASIVTDRLPNQDATTGQTIAKVAQVMGLDPNANLTAGQIRRAQGLVQKYAASSAPASDANAGTLPPSANAGTPAPPASSATAPAAPSSFNDRFASAGGGAPQAAPPAAAAAVAPQAAPGGAPAQPQPQPQPQAQPQAAPPAAQAQQPLVPQPQLPKGFTDPMAAAAAYREKARQVSALRGGAGLAAQYNAEADRIENSIKPIEMMPGRTLVDPRTAQPIYGGSRLTNGETLDADAERYRQTGSLPQNLGAGYQGRQEAAAIRGRATEIELNQGGDPAKWADRWQDFKAKGVGKSAAERTKANREENLNLILKAADAAIPAALEASKALPRGNYVPLNKLIQKGEIMSSDPRLVEFGMANLQLAEHWARAMNPTGVMRESDRDKALSFLDTAYGNNTYERAVMQLQKQITRERDAVRGGGTILKDGKAPAPSEELKTTEWVRGPDGKLGPSK